MIFLCLHGYFWAQLRPAGSWAANHMPFYTRNLFSLWTRLQLLPSSDFLNFWRLSSISTSAAHPFALVNIPFQASWTWILHTFLGSVHSPGFGDLYSISQLVTFPAFVLRQSLNVLAPELHGVVMIIS